MTEKRRLRTYPVSSGRAYKREGRASAAKRGYGREWQRRRRAYLMQNPLCVDCRAIGKLTAATEVDHVTPHRGDEQLFWAWDNLQGLCKSHHSRKTGRGE